MDCPLFSRRFRHISCPKEITVWSFLGDDASLDESGDLDRGSSSSSHFSEKLGDDDHVRFEGKEILRRKLQGKQSMLTEDDTQKVAF